MGKLSRKLSRKLGATTLYVAYLVLAVAILDYVVFYGPYVRKLRETPGEFRASQDPARVPLRQVPGVDPAVVGLLGRIDTAKSSSFTRFPRTKASGTVRVCCFGDSYTHGDEVDETHDYPSILQRLLRRTGFQDAEVLNFGSGGFGFHQTYILWDRVGRDFGCDAVLLGPRGFQAARDTTFGLLHDWSPYYLHARYVLDGGDVRLVEVSGTTYGERFDHYFRFVPRWRYLRYSRHPPAFLQAMVPRGRQLPNPFYYDRRSAEAEARETYEILLAKMAASGSAILLGHHRRPIVDLAEGLGAENLTAVPFHERLSFPYLATSHAGPLGNELLARQFLAHLTGRLDTPIPVLDVEDLDWTSPASSPPDPPRALSSYAEIFFEIAGTAIGFLDVPDAGTAALQTDALLALSGSEESVLDGYFVALDVELAPGMEVVLRSGAPPRSRDYPLGTVALAGGGLNLGVVKIDGFERMSYKDLLRMQDLGRPSPLTHGRKRRSGGLFFRGNDRVEIDEIRSRGSTISLRVGGEPVLRGEIGDLGETEGIWWTAEERFRIARARTRGLPDIDALPESGSIEIVAEHWQDGTVRVPVARWRKAALSVPRAGRPAPGPVLPRPDETAGSRPR